MAVIEEIGIEQVLHRDTRLSGDSDYVVNLAPKLSHQILLHPLLNSILEKLTGISLDSLEIPSIQLHLKVLVFLVK